MKKRVGLLATLAMCVTFGGVYATWTFAEGEIQTVEDTQTKISIEGSTKVPKGILEVTNNNISFTIDDTNSDHVAEIIADGSVTVTLTKNAQVDCADISQVVISCTVTVGGDMFKTTLTDALKSGAGETSWTISADELGIEFENALQIHTQAEYDDVENSLSDDTITLTFSAE